MVGEQFEYGDEICGAVVSVRSKQERVAIWTKNASNEAVQVLHQVPLKWHGQH
jgi:translation initiation factor 4E